jgi:hypothetical protein
LIEELDTTRTFKRIAITPEPMKDEIPLLVHNETDKLYYFAVTSKTFINEHRRLLPEGIAPFEIKAHAILLYCPSLGRLKISTIPYTTLATNENTFVSEEALVAIRQTHIYSTKYHEVRLRGGNASEFISYYRSASGYNAPSLSARGHFFIDAAFPIKSYESVLRKTESTFTHVKDKVIYASALRSKKHKYITAKKHAWYTVCFRHFDGSVSVRTHVTLNDFDTYDVVYSSMCAINDYKQFVNELKHNDVKTLKYDHLTDTLDPVTISCRQVSIDAERERIVNAQVNNLI